MLGIVLSGWAVGYALAAVGSGLILTYAGWRWVFFVGLLPALLTIWTSDFIVAACEQIPL